MKEFLKNYMVNGQVVELQPMEVVLTMGIAFVFAVLLYMIYKITYSGVMYSKRFNISILVITMVTTMVMIVIGSNLALSLGMVGALSIVRFRTAVKDPRDTAFIFWGIVIGLCCGTGNYVVAGIGSLFIAIVLLIFKGTYNDGQYLLVIRGTRENEKDIYATVFKHYKSSVMRTKNTREDSLEIIYEINMKNGMEDGVTEDLYAIEGVKIVNIIAKNGEMIG